MVLPKDKEKTYLKVPLEEKFNGSDKEAPRRYGYGIRHAQMLLLFFCLIVNSMARSHLGVTIVAMTSVDKNVTQAVDYIHGTELNTSFAQDQNNKSDVLYKTNRINENNATESEDFTIYKIYGWPKSIQETVLSSFNMGYIIMKLPMAMTSQKWGGKIPCQIALLVNSVASIPVPWIVAWGGWKALCFCRILLGMGQAGLRPAIFTIFANWVATSEKGRLLNYVFAGGFIGMVISFQSSGTLSSSSFGWPAVFWVTGVVNLIMFIIITWFISSTPDDDKYICEKEKSYILGATDSGDKKQLPVPWKSLLTSKPIWAVILTEMGSGTAYLFCCSQFATYFHHVLEVNIKDSGILSSLPFLTTLFSSVCFGILCDYLINRKIFCIRITRILFNSIAEVGLGLSLILVSFTRNSTLAVVAFITAITCHSAVNSGASLSFVDMAPNYVGTLMGIGNTIECIAGLILPIVVSHVIIDMTNQIQWRIMFFIISGTAILGNIVYAIFVSGDIQHWNSYKETDEINDVKEKEK